MADNRACRVCGFLEGAPPWGSDGRTPSFEICVCCGVEYGYEDSTLDGAKQYRRRWMDEGARWAHPKFKPEGWSLDQQLANISPDFQ